MANPTPPGRPGRNALRTYLENLKGKPVYAQFTGGDVVKGTLENIHQGCFTVSGTICILSHLVWIRPQK